MDQPLGERWTDALSSIGQTLGLAQGDEAVVLGMTALHGDGVAGPTLVIEVDVDASQTRLSSRLQLRRDPPASARAPAFLDGQPLGRRRAVVSGPSR